MFNWNNDTSVPQAASGTAPEATPSHGGGQQGGFPGNLSKEQAAAAVAKLIAATIGEAVVVLSRSPAHKHFAFADIEWMLLPPVLSGQAFVAEAANKENGARVPIALITWARVSADVDRKLTESIGQAVRLRPDEWTSGNILWIIDAVGDPRAVNASLSGLLQGPLKDRDAKLVLRDPNGQLKVASLREMVATAQAQAAAQNGPA